MSRLHLLHEITTVVKMTTNDFDEVKLQVYLDDLLSNYSFEAKELGDHENDTLNYISMFLNNLKLENFSNHTITNYGYELRVFARFINKGVVQISTSDIRQYLSSFNNLQSSTISSKINVLRSFFSWLTREEVILRNPMNKIRNPKQPKRLKEGLSLEELEIVRESCESLRQRALLEMFYSTGCRLSELRSLNKEDIDWQNECTRVIGKGDKERIVYLSFRALIHLKKYLNSREDNHPALFVTERKYNGEVRRISNRAIQREIEKIEKNSKLQKRLTPHIMRHTFARLSMDAGIDLTDLQHLLGHSNPSTTLGYSPVSEERKRQAFKKFHIM